MVVNEEKMARLVSPEDTRKMNRGLCREGPFEGAEQMRWGEAALNFLDAPGVLVENTPEL